jgi:hypothetical protein
MKLKNYSIFFFILYVSISDCYSQKLDLFKFPIGINIKEYLAGKKYKPPQYLPDMPGMIKYEIKDLKDFYFGDVCLSSSDDQENNSVNLLANKNDSLMYVQIRSKVTEISRSLKKKLEETFIQGTVLKNSVITDNESIKSGEYNYLWEDNVNKKTYLLAYKYLNGDIEPRETIRIYIFPANSIIKEKTIEAYSR